MKIKRTIFIATLAALMLGAAGFGYFRLIQPKVDAFNPQPDPPGFGMVGISNGQSIRVNVVNTAIPPDPIDQANPARVVIIFRDENGARITNANGEIIRRVVELKGGESTSLQLNADNFIREGRIQLRPEVRIQRADSTNGIPPDPIIPTVEIFNNANGRTQFMLNYLPAVQRSIIAN